MEHDVRGAGAVTKRDAAGIFAAVVFAGFLFAPLRHYVGDLSDVEQAKKEKDSFPFSTYPMFTAYRHGCQSIPHVVGFTSDGSRVHLDYRHFGSGGLNQVRRQISRAMRRGQATRVAQRYADALRRRARSREKDVIEVAVVRSRFIFDEYFGHGADGATNLPFRERVHATCVVGGQAVGFDPPIRWKSRGLSTRQE
ncbi:hypothetical protein [Nesterenkonia marinintestina]|uniref:hypothetical protein n=1 Tax=Nesterenkonia marinintestina TaxID=2979865 RepID=UPI0021C15393|nr:hypothetical protein [Nesterenkonia sp. GX14115]